ncbi:hypothetical protein GLOIN_2v1777589 [Rhizophagus irregularis DAOM 181602=DAOM 197198]|uniref:Uncharacterized protein n=1 Tax=Rhizophagus irregularis (strain DAOM 181602 / DAOM 197198 / MUCL 43194) TaxID=747089 RepID=A0A2P4PUI3_RHIID|nr:hypothetical protein GLOIN_2v1777589 [Rhizophagus irregularis DAOM 181602=DAOM 197198]POG69010.1 hypothetical protein GLOIN_2v1777589 [Rhizophagus irregularis DAOM 181602=DAOM 197198]|eukprot:XP_025175876.1 hypothetical protein GLOIN_2v1777589 [Rhizophagus irregularis DAOM 181602=DAOM 197198]
MLSEKKWRFMEELVIILKEFEKITRILNGSNYITLSLLYPLISKLKCFIGDMIKKYQNNENNNNNEILSNDEIQEDILEKFEEIPDSESANIIEINENRSKKNLNISNPIKIKRLVLLFLNTFSKSLEKYWLVFSNVGLLATLLDLHSKKLICFEKSLIDSIFGEEENEDNGDENEVKEYLKLKPIRNIDFLLVFHTN